MLVYTVTYAPTAALAALASMENMRGETPSSSGLGFRSCIGTRSCVVGNKCSAIETPHSSCASLALANSYDVHAVNFGDGLTPFRDGFSRICADKGACVKIAASDGDAAEARPRAGENAQFNTDFPQLLVDWQTCFAKKEVNAQNVAMIVAACDRAAGAFSNPMSGERQRLAKRRLKLLESVEQKQETEMTRNGEVRSEGK